MVDMTAVKPSYYLDTEVLCLLDSVYWEVESKIDSTLHFEAEIFILPICFLVIIKSSEAGLPEPLLSPPHGLCSNTASVENMKSATPTVGRLWGTILF